MKIAPLVHAVEAHNRRGPDRTVGFYLVHTGQHYDEKMSEVFFRELGMPKPDINLDVGSGSHAVQTANVMLRFEPILLEQRPDWVIVVGDVNSTLACTIVASKLGIKVAHVEAGLRSYDRTMPEEINRLVTDALADLLLTPSADGDENLRREGVPPERIQLVGNIMIDSLVVNLPRSRSSDIARKLNLEPGKFIYSTLHRPSNVDDRHSLAAILAQFESVGQKYPVIFPLHPRTRKMMGEFGLSSRDSATIRFIDPVGYHDSLYLVENARFILTDSGGLQEESTYFRTPCLTLRPNTERPITVSVGSNRLTKLDRLQADIDGILSREPRFGEVPPLWDGQTAGRIIDSLLSRS